MVGVTIFPSGYLRAHASIGLGLCAVRAGSGEPLRGGCSGSVSGSVGLGRRRPSVCVIWAESVAGGWRLGLWLWLAGWRAGWREEGCVCGL